MTGPLSFLLGLIGGGIYWKINSKKDKNNWNVEAKNRETEASYLSSLHKDFLRNKEQISLSLQTLLCKALVLKFNIKI